MTNQEQIKQAQKRRYEAAESLRRLDDRILKKRVNELLSSDQDYLVLQEAQKIARAEIHVARLNLTKKEAKFCRILKDLGDLEWSLREHHSAELIATEELAENAGNMALLHERALQQAREELDLASISRQPSEPVSFAASTSPTTDNAVPIKVTESGARENLPESALPREQGA